MPDALRFEADWAYFQSALDAADVTLLGRLTHEAAPNAKRRRRLVASRRVPVVVQEDVSTWWINPDDVTLASAVMELFGSSADVAVVGGTAVFDWVLAEGGFDEFHLTLAHRVRLGAGRPLFGAAKDLDAAFQMLEEAGLEIVRRSWFDRDQGLELLVFRHALKLRR